MDYHESNSCERRKLTNDGQRKFMTGWNKLSKSRFVREFACTLAALMMTISTAAVAEDTITLKRSELEAMVQSLVDERLKDLGLVSEDGFNKRVATGIQAYVANQQAEAEAQKHAKAKYARKVSDNDYVYGSRSAPFSLIEYSDYECPFCKRFHATPKLLVDKYAGKINWVYRHFPLGFHNPHAQKQAEAAECAAELQGNDGFWKYGDEIYKRTRSNKGFAIAKLVPLAEELGFDKMQFEECFNSGRHAAKVRADMADGQKAGVNGTPGNILRHNPSNTSMVLSGALSLEEIEKSFAELASKAGESLN